MEIRKNWRHDIVLLGGILILGLFVWMGSRLLDKTDSTPIRGYGGKLSRKVVTVLERMNEDLMNTKGILSAQPGRILFVDENHHPKEYSFAYGTLWCNDFPVISGVRAFHFEYRDGAGNLLTRAEENLSAVETVVYTIRVAVNETDVMASYRAQIPFARLGGRWKDRDRTSLVAAAKH